MGCRRWARAVECGLRRLRVPGLLAGRHHPHPDGEERGPALGRGLRRPCHDSFRPRTRRWDRGPCRGPVARRRHPRRRVGERARAVGHRPGPGESHPGGAYGRDQYPGLFVRWGPPGQRLLRQDRPGVGGRHGRGCGHLRSSRFGRGRGVLPRRPHPRVRIVGRDPAVGDRDPERRPDPGACIDGQLPGPVARWRHRGHRLGQLGPAGGHPNGQGMRPLSRARPMSMP